MFHQNPDNKPPSRLFPNCQHSLCLLRRCPQPWSRCSQRTAALTGARGAAASPVWWKTTPCGPTSSGSLTSRCEESETSDVLFQAEFAQCPFSRRVWPKPPILVFPQEGKVVFEQELYNNFSTYLPKPYFITFAGDVSSPFCTFSSSCSLFTFIHPIEKESSQNGKAELYFSLHLLDATKCVHSWFFFSEYFVSNY